MLFKVYGAPLSPSTRRVALVAKDRNIPYEIVPVNLRAAEHKQPAHLQHHRCAAITDEEIHKLYRGETPNEGRLKELIPQLDNKLEGFEAILSKQKHLVGNEIILADLFFLPTGSVIFEHLRFRDLENVDGGKRYYPDLRGKQLRTGLDTG
ncbi:hypothetical protein BC827DRAFT_1267479 [Russula dissimulans]|nr:hypothetical protein BC827DRAFT_1267479 [Russula dissimulans]